MLGKTVEVDVLAGARQTDRIARAVVMKAFFAEIDVEVVGGAGIGGKRLVSIGLARHRGDGRFIAALIGSSAVALVYLGRADDRPVGPHRLHVGLVAGGVLLATLTGLLGYLEGDAPTYLAPLYTYLGSVHLTTSMIFDVGVYAAVLGLVMIAFDKLGNAEQMPDEDDAPLEPAGPANPREEERA